jgi:hypothetical protein
MSVQEQIARAGDVSRLVVSSMNLQTRHSRRSRIRYTLVPVVIARNRTPTRQGGTGIHERIAHG